MDDTVFDYVIVGAGSAGCVLANRLSADPAVRVALIEAGPGTWNPFVDMPRAWVTLGSDPARSWRFPVRGGAGRESETWARGRGLGGSSAINGMIYCRGQPEDYDAWRTFGAEGWDWSDIEPAFRAIEDLQVEDEDPTPRGKGGPVAISRRALTPRLEAAVFEAAAGLGLARLADLNGAAREGIGRYDHTISRDGVRSSAARAFLGPVRGRANLTILCRTSARRVIFKDRTAIGVECLGPRGEAQLMARREVILSAGALLSPDLLQRSGVGDAARLIELGLEPVFDNAAVGENLGEHLVLALPHALHGMAGHNREFRGARLALNLARYYLLHRGVLTYGASELGGFVRSSPHLGRPDVQLALSPYSFNRASSGRWPRPDTRPGFTIIGYLLHPRSRGRVRFTDPAAATPEIDAGWFDDEEDCGSAIRMMDLMRAFVRQPALSAFVGREQAPGPGVVSREDKLLAIRRQFVSGLHAVGTCRLGSGPGAVVDSRLRVIGVTGLRVVDASVIPAPPSGNTNGPVMALAWRAADLILADARQVA